jgi:hypothetical protein
MRFNTGRGSSVQGAGAEKPRRKNRAQCHRQRSELHKPANNGQVPRRRQVRQMCDRILFSRTYGTITISNSGRRWWRVR